MNDNINSLAVTDVKRFEEEQDLIEQSINEIDELYNEIKDHFDRVKNSLSKGSLSFIEKQTSNLVSLKTAKTSMIKEKVNIKKLQADLQMKNDKINSGDEGDNIQIVNQVAQYLMKNDMAVNQIEDQYSGIIGEEEEYTEVKKLTESVDDQLARRLKELEDSGEIQYTDNEIGISFENKRVAIAVLKRGKAWNFGAIDENGEIIKNYPVPNKADYKIKLVKEDGEIVAVDQDDKVYKVINV